MENDLLENIVNSLTVSLVSQRNLSVLNHGTIKNVVTTEVSKRSGEIIGIVNSGNQKRLKKISEEIEAKAKAILHQTWDAYFGTRPKWDKLLLNVQEKGIQVVDDLLQIHSSTRERLHIYPDFYNKIFAITGKPKSILDTACGFNPLSWGYMDLEAGTKYYASDIDNEEIVFLKNVFAVFKPNVQFEFTCKDLIVDSFPPVDVALLFKTLQPIEMQKKGSAAEVIHKLQAKWFVITFPTKSLSGKQKGMREFYIDWFDKNISNVVRNSELLEFDSELVYVCMK